MRDLKNFNNNPNMSLFSVKYKPKSARGLFGASPHNHPSDSLMGTSKHRSKINDQSKDNATDILNLVTVRSCPAPAQPTGSQFGLKRDKRVIF